MDQLLNLARQLVQGVFGKASSAKAQEVPQSDLSQMKISYGALPSVQPSAVPSSNGVSPEQVQQGYLKYNPTSPLATQSGVISQALSSLSPKIDPKLVLALALKESGGGRDLVGRQEGLNNPYNVKYGGKLINYPDLKTALMGGDNPIEGSPSRGLINVLNSPLYQKYQQSGNLEDFFNTYSPPSDNNPPMSKQIGDIRNLMKNWQ